MSKSVNRSRSNYFYREDKDIAEGRIQKGAEKERKFRMTGEFRAREKTVVLLHTPLLYRRKGERERERERNKEQEGERERGNCSKVMKGSNNWKI